MKYDDCKRCPDRHGQLRYKLRNSRVWVSNFGFHHTGFLDPVSTTQHGPVGAPLDEHIRRSIENDLQFNRSRFTSQVDLVKTRCHYVGSASSMSAVAADYSSRSCSRRSPGDRY